MKRGFLERAMAAKWFDAALVACVLACFSNASAWAQPEGQNPPPGCRAWNADLPKEWQPWAAMPVPVTAAASPDRLAQAIVRVGRKASVTLAPAKSVHMRVETPDIDPPADAHDGMLSLHVPEDGYYWIAVSSGLWIDVVAAGAILDSTDHGPGPHCASISKSVQFMLKAGDVQIQLSDNRGPHVDLLVTSAP
jgi:hypothetical protein